MNNYYKVMAIASSAVFFLSGCQMNTMPEMSKEQSGLVAQYAANLILTNTKKHDTGIATQAEIEKEEAKKERQRVREEAAKKATDQTQESDGSNDRKDSVVMEDGDLAQFLGMQDITITYESNEICDAYAEDESEECFFSMNATEGNQLLILKFQIQNNSTEDREVNILDQYPLFKVSVNDGEYKNAQTTLLLNDLSTYKGAFTAGESKEEVLVIQLSEEEVKEGVKSLLLRTKSNNQSMDIRLQ